ncbi:hypothetical protein HaLaN_06808 [Haematococcus lacustris]|uniref:Uncharacterized protein n=1 Tax=Haematococcus lacustris TaxID=44745 RepID=A0A699YWA4_HAELA|nr:hypothetical protein HaLaN_06808 [Haematococcus lacustris]
MALHLLQHLCCPSPEEVLALQQQQAIREEAQPGLHIHTVHAAQQLVHMEVDLGSSSSSEQLVHSRADSQQITADSQLTHSRADPHWLMWH